MVAAAKAAEAHDFILGLTEAANYPACVKTVRLWFPAGERAIATDSDKTNIKERFKQLSPHTDVRFI